MRAAERAGFDYETIFFGFQFFNQKNVLGEIPSKGNLLAVYTEVNQVGNIDLSRLSGILFDIEDHSRPYLYKVLGITGRCPSCGGELGVLSFVTLMEGKRSYCKSCKWKGTARDRTPLKKSRLTDAQALFLLVLIEVGADPDEASKFLDISKTTFSAWKERVKLGELLADC